MIPRQAVVAWRRHAPWAADAMVEQDLVISRALVEMYSQPEIARRLAFRGGTALHKIHLPPAARYSEDIDLVQVAPQPIGETLDLLRSTLDGWLGAPQRVLKEGRVNLVYRFHSEDAPPIRMRLKVEINSREHFHVLGLHPRIIETNTAWFRGQAAVTTFRLEELLATKLRALYQRRKGRDLFDLWHALRTQPVNRQALVECFQHYMAAGGHVVTRAHFEENLHEKRSRADFRGDMSALLRPGVAWDFEDALRAVGEQLVARLPGAPWKCPA